MGPVGSFLRYFAGALCPIGSFTDLLRARFFSRLQLGWNIFRCWDHFKKKKVSVFFMFVSCFFFQVVPSVVASIYALRCFFFHFFCRRSPPGRAFADDEGLEESLWSTKKTRRLQVLKDSIKKHSQKNSLNILKISTLKILDSQYLRILDSQYSHFGSLLVSSKLFFACILCRGENVKRTILQHVFGGAPGTDLSGGPARNFGVGKVDKNGPFWFSHVLPKWWSKSNLSSNYNEQLDVLEQLQCNSLLQWLYIEIVWNICHQNNEVKPEQIWSNNLHLKIFAEPNDRFRHRASANPLVLRIVFASLAHGPSGPLENSGGSSDCSSLTEWWLNKKNRQFHQIYQILLNMAIPIKSY